MFGYVKPLHTELLVREYDFYRAAYCGVCRAMRKNTGFLSSLSLSYDFVFLALCRMLLSDGHVACRKCRCVAHPFHKRSCLSENEGLVYAARVGALLARDKLADDRQDHGFGKRLRAFLAYPVFAKAARRASLPALSDKMRMYLAELSRMEKERTPSIDQPAEQFGFLLGEVFAEGLDDPVRETFYKVGFHLGRFIYAADAAEDITKDEKSGDYNPYILLYGKGNFGAPQKKSAKTALLLELDALGKVTEQLPFGNYLTVEHIIKNTVYLGLPARIRFLDVPQNTERKE